MLRADDRRCPVGLGSRVTVSIRDIPTIVRGACPHNCPDRCVWDVAVEGGRAVDLSGDPDHPFTRGGLCAKVDHYLDRVYAEDRVLSPLRRSGPKGEARFERVSWDEALDDIAERLQQIVDADGAEAILPYSFSGTLGLVQNESPRRFFHALGASRLDRTVCGSTVYEGLEATQGTDLGILPDDIVHSRFIVLWGANVVVTNLHLWPLIRQAKAAGATVVAIDPVTTRTAQAADWHIAPLPGTDAALALGMMHVIIRDGLHDADYVERFTVGFEALAERAAEYAPERVATITGLDVDEIERFARAYATTKPSVIRLMVGAEKHRNGGMMIRSISCLPPLVGAWRDRGGGLMPTIFDLYDGLNWDAVITDDDDARIVNMIKLGEALTDPALSPPIRSLIVYNSNPAVINPNQGLVLQGLARQDLFTVVLEQLPTDTTSYADYVLPATTQVEHLDLLTSYGFAYLALNKPAIEPRGDAIPNSEFFRRLATRMGMDDPALQASDEALIRAVLDTQDPRIRGITYEHLDRHGWAPLNLPHDWMPFAEGGFATASGKAEFSSQALAARGFDPLPTHSPARHEDAVEEPEQPLTLIAAKTGIHFLNSSYGGLERHTRAEREPRVDVCDKDAAARGIVDGDLVRIWNERGELELRARVGDRVRPGVVAIPFGWWSSTSPGGRSVNTLTSDGLADMGGGGDFFDTQVFVTPVTEVAEPAATDG